MSDTTRTPIAKLNGWAIYLVQNPRRPSYYAVLKDRFCWFTTFDVDEAYEYCSTPIGSN